MPDFNREERYIVVKIKGLSGMHAVKLHEYLKRKGLDEHLVECVVVESDWPIYDETWENVQRLVEGNPSIRDEMSAKLFDEHKAKVKAEAERDALAAHVERLNTVLFQTMAAIDDGDIEAIPYDLARDVHNEAPETSLAKLKAQWQAERDEWKEEARLKATEAEAFMLQRDALAAAYKELDDLVSREYGASFSKSSPLAEAWAELTDPDLTCLERQAESSNA